MYYVPPASNCLVGSSLFSISQLQAMEQALQSSATTYIIQRYDLTRPAPKEIISQVPGMYERNTPRFVGEEEATAGVLERRKDTEAVQHLIETGRSLIVAMLQDRMLGLVDCYPSNDGTHLNLSWILVEEDYRRNGVAAALHEEFEKMGEEMAIQVGVQIDAVLLVHTENLCARRRYDAWGYKVMEEEGNKVRMVKSLLP